LRTFSLKFDLFLISYLLMLKDYKNWHVIKDQINALDSEKIFYNENEIWWCHIGLNVGIEQDGKGEKYMRPVLIAFIQ